ncbi:hypothetical protein P3T76_008136 [Phytophthora citrophthora]|uniref:RING-type domain-containing protein n=1 Tax=Phytophthora citrophthora TaxID=4793 RepID=A0AAD9LLB3_9STRA|nr:hypothetical protein P3T76_008136 [Phytophthora citrophthora]
MQTQGKTQVVAIAEEARSILYELGSILNQRYRDRGPSHQTQQSLRRKNAVISRLDQFITDQQRVSEVERPNGEDQKATIEILEKQLEDQKAAFEQERESLQQQATQASVAQVKLRSSLDVMLPQLRELLEVYDREERGFVDHDQSTTTRTVTITGDASNQDAVRRLTTLQTSFDQERAQLLKKATDAANTQQAISRKNLTEREAVLTCPISLDLFENPVVTTCCGKTFSSEALSQALRQSPQCPVCRAYGVSTHANRDIANLVEIHRTERSMLGLPENSATAVRSNNSVNTGTTFTTTTPEATRTSALGDRSTAASNRESTGYAARENNNRNQRSQRVQDRNAVPHRQTPSTSARRQGGRGYDSRRQSTGAASSGYSNNTSTQAWQPSSTAANSTYGSSSYLPPSNYYGYGLGYDVRPYGGTGYSTSDSDY